MFLDLWPLLSSKPAIASPVLLPLYHADADFLPPASTFKDPCDYLEPTG